MGMCFMNVKLNYQAIIPKVVKKYNQIFTACKKAFSLTEKAFLYNL